MCEKRAKAFFEAVWRCIVLELPDVLLLGCDEETFPLCVEMGKDRCLQAITVEDALFLLQENPEVFLIVIDCHCRSDDDSIADARTLRQNGFSGWMIAVCANSRKKRSFVRTEYDLSCSKYEVGDMVKSLM